MSHKTFAANIESIYGGMSSYEDMRNFDRIEKLFNVIQHDKDFRYLLPLFLKNDFDAVFFLDNTQAQHPEIYDLARWLYVQTRAIALQIKKSQASLSRGSISNRCATPVIDVSKFEDSSNMIENTISQPAHEYKLKASFFYQDKMNFNLAGPLYLAQKNLSVVNGKQKDWNALPVEDRKIVDNSCVIEYYIFTGGFPVEGKFVKDDAKCNAKYLKPTLAGLRAALKAKDPMLLGCNMSALPELPLSVRKLHVNLIKANYLTIKQYTKKCDMPYLTTWMFSKNI